MPKPNASNQSDPPRKGRGAKKEEPKGAKLAARRPGGTKSPPAGRAGRRAVTEVVFKLHWKWRLVFLAFMGALAVCLVYGVWAQFYDLAELGVMPQRTWVCDFRGKPFSRLSGEDRVTVPIKQVSPYFVNALLAREDSRFYRHFGVDPVGIARAVVRNVIHLHAREGASTLTQQLARNSFPLGGRNLHRKLLEAFVAMRIEANFSKQKILESYVNRIYFGSGFYGVETASRAYFGKKSADLTLSEAAILAGLIRSPNRFSPFRNLEASILQRDTVLGRMAQLGMITAQQEAAAKSEEVKVATVRPPSAQQNYALDLVEQELSLILDDDLLAEGGLRVYTSFDPDLQSAAQEALDTELTKIEQRPGYNHPKRADFGPTDGSRDTPYLQGAVIVLDNATGGIRAIVGGRNYMESRLNRAYSRRQLGSTFKPFVYAAAYAGGSVRPGTAISDGPIRRGEMRRLGNWSPNNSDGTFRGMLPAEEGLILSRNTMSVRVGDRAGLEAVRKIADEAGFGQTPKFPSIYLGAFEASLKQVASAYTLFPNGGVRRQPFLIDRVEDASGQTIYRSARIETRVLNPGVSWMVSSALEKVLQRGTAASSGFHKPAAGKTGTTNDFKDAWFVGYTRSLTCGVWVGFDRPAVIMAHGYGATLALPVWSDVMNASVEKRYAATSFTPPRGYASSRSSSGGSDRPLPNRIFNSFRHLFSRD